MKRMMVSVSVILLSAISVFATVSQNAGKLLITEVAMKEADDWIELYVVDGTIDWSGYRIKVGSNYKTSLPVDWNLHDGDYIIIHEESGTNDANKSDNNPNYWDIYGMGGLKSTDQVIQLIEPSRSAKKVDCVIYSNHDGGFTGGKTDANSAVADGMWNAYDFSTGDAGAWTSTVDISSGQSLCRYMNSSHNGYVDHNSKSDWYRSTSPSPGSENDNSLPVFLTSFSAVPQNSHILIKWTTQSEINTLGFKVLRRVHSTGDFAPVSSLIRGAGNSTIEHRYQFIDRDVQPDVTYYYRLKDIDFNGHSAVHAIVSASLSGQTEEPGTWPDHVQLSEGYPNPFGPGVGKTEVGFNVRVSENSARKMDIGIWNLLGERVKHFEWNGSHAGVRAFFWNGTGENGLPVPAGVYFLRVRRENLQKIRKILFIR